MAARLQRLTLGISELTAVNSDIVGTLKGFEILTCVVAKCELAVNNEYEMYSQMEWSQRASKCVSVSQFATG